MSDFYKYEQYSSAKLASHSLNTYNWGVIAMETRKEKQVHILVIIIALISALVILFEVLVSGDKFLDHSLSATLSLALFGTGIMGLNAIKKK